MAILLYYYFNMAQYLHKLMQYENPMLEQLFTILMIILIILLIIYSMNLNL